MMICCCNLAGTAACYTCLNNPACAYSPVKYVRVDDYFSPPKTNTPKQPQTNADRIRSMTDEELAVWISALYTTQYHVGADPHHWLEWLKLEAE